MKKQKKLEQSRANNYIVGVDIGGTFTDVVLIDKENNWKIGKVPSNPKNPQEAIMEALKLVAQMENMSLQEFLDKVTLMIQATTKADNALLQWKFARTGLIGTKGFRDIIELRQGQKEERYNYYLELPQVLVPRYLRLTVEERMLFTGKVAIPLNEADVVRAVSRLKSEGVESIAICLLHSYANPAHEQKIREIVEKELPECYVSVSSEVLPQMREYPRTCTTVMNACLGPLLNSYVDGIEDTLRSSGYKGQNRYVQSNGGLTGAEVLKQKAVTSIHSGRSTGPAAGIFIGRLFGRNDLITIEMGGTSFDACLIREGVTEMISGIKIGRYNIGVPFLRVETMGVGGGSIAWIDQGGILHVGPQSAEAVPGPACYMKGGKEPTVTDANVVLGYFNQTAILGGNLPIDSKAAAKAINDKIATPLNMDLKDAALGILKVINSNMSRAIGAVSVERGLDPRNYALVVGGSCGPAHAASLAKELGITYVMIPRIAPAICAFGHLVSAIRHDYCLTLPMLQSKLDYIRLNQGFDRLESEAYRDLEKDGVSREHVHIERSLDMKYHGEIDELSVPIRNSAITRNTLPDIEKSLHQDHERLYTFYDPTRKFEIIGIRVSAYGPRPDVKVRERPFRGTDPSNAKKEVRLVYFENYGDYVEVPIYDGSKIQVGNIVYGPAIVEEPYTTIVVIPGSRLELDGREIYVMTFENGK